MTLPPPGGRGIPLTLTAAGGGRIGVRGIVALPPTAAAGTSPRRRGVAIGAVMPRSPPSARRRRIWRRRSGTAAPSAGRRTAPAASPPLLFPLQTLLALLHRLPTTAILVLGVEVLGLCVQVCTSEEVRVR